MINVPHFPLVIPMEKRNMIWKSVTRVGTMPKRVKKAFTSAAGTPVFSNLTVVAHSRREDAHLDRVEHAPVRRHVLRSHASCRRDASSRDPAACKASRPEHPRRRSWAGFRIRDRFRIPGLEEPVVLLLKLPADAPDRLPEVDGLADHLLGEGIARPTIHHCRGYVVRCHDRVERRRRRVHHVGLIEALSGRWRRGHPECGCTKPATAPPAACASSAWRRWSAPLCVAGSPRIAK